MKRRAEFELDFIFGLAALIYSWIGSVRDAGVIGGEIEHAGSPCTVANA